jgi:hypothetical protein
MKKIIKYFIPYGMILLCHKVKQVVHNIEVWWCKRLLLKSTKGFSIFLRI